MLVVKNSFGALLACKDFKRLFWKLSSPELDDRALELKWRSWVKEFEEMLPSYRDIIKHFRKEVWVIPVLAAAGSIILIILIFEIYLVSQTVKSSPSRRHLFLGQMLLVGLLQLVLGLQETHELYCQKLGNCIE